MEFVNWYNGEAIADDHIKLAIDDPGLLYGATVFTTLRIYDSLDHVLTNWSGHCDRLKSTIAAFHWNAPNWEQVRSGAERLSIYYPVLRITIFPDGREWITGRGLPTDLTERQQKGITAEIAASQLLRSLPQHKTGNYLAPWLALRSAQQNHAQEAILIDQTGNWLETSTGTLWGWRDSVWSTPVSDQILPGLARSHLIQRLKWQNEEVVEETWNAGVVERLEAIAYTNCVIEIIPIHTVVDRDSKQFYDAQHPKFQQLRNVYGLIETDSQN